MPGISSKVAKVSGCSLSKLFSIRSQGTSYCLLPCKVCGKGTILQIRLHICMCTLHNIQYTSITPPHGQRTGEVVEKRGTQSQYRREYANSCEDMDKPKELQGMA